MTKAPQHADKEHCANKPSVEGPPAKATARRKMPSLVVALSGALDQVCVMLATDLAAKPDKSGKLEQTSPETGH